MAEIRISANPPALPSTVAGVDPNVRRFLEYLRTWLTALDRKLSELDKRIATLEH